MKQGLLNLLSAPWRTWVRQCARWIERIDPEQQERRERMVRESWSWDYDDWEKRKPLNRK